MRNILLPIFGDDAGEARLAAAIGLARAFGGHIDCVQARSPSAYVMTDPIGGAYVLDAARRRLGEEEAAVRAAVERRLAGEATAWSFEHVDGDPLRVILARARLADVVVLSRVIARAGAEDPLPIASAVVTEGPAPVLAVPPQWELTAIRRGGFDCAGDAVVAWDGSIGAARALHAALPLLARALSIKVMTVRNDDCRVTPAAVVTYLARHGLEASAHEFDRPHVRAEVAVLDALYALGGDYLVMGAFGHGRLRERLFGGVTRQCLVESPVPLFLAA